MEAQEAIKQAKTRAAELRKELDALKAQKPYDEMTVSCSTPSLQHMVRVASATAVQLSFPCTD